MGKYKFETDDEGERLCYQIYMAMMSLFGISKEEAIARINQEWESKSLTKTSAIYHIVPEEWAKNIYWGHDSYWWIEGEKRENLKLPPLTPQPLRKS
jgi:hypothetical protein